MPTYRLLLCAFMIQLNVLGVKIIHDLLKLLNLALDVVGVSSVGCLHVIVDWFHFLAAAEKTIASLFTTRHNIEKNLNTSYNTPVYCFRFFF